MGTITTAPRGRPRRPQLDQAILAVTRRLLAERGFAAMSLAAIAEEAGTTTPAIYRRWPSKAALAAQAMETFPGEGVRAPGGEDPFTDLVAELTDFRRAIGRPGRISLVGTMLQAATDANARARYQTRVITPRRDRLRRIFERAQAAGLLDADADIETALTMCTGSWYARCLAGSPAPPHWPRRTAALVWRALGGTLPPDRSHG